MKGYNYVRWIGAFGKGSTLSDSLNFEIYTCDRDVACEICKGYTSRISHAKIGLLLDNCAIIKKFNGDCWSKNNNGMLYMTRNPKYASRHLEAWARPNYKGIVVKSVRKVSTEAFRQILAFVEETGIKVYEFETFKELNLVQLRRLGGVN